MLRTFRVGEGNSLCRTAKIFQNLKRNYYFLSKNEVTAEEVLKETRFVGNPSAEIKKNRIREFKNDQQLFCQIMSTTEIAESKEQRLKALENFNQLLSSHHLVEWRLTMEIYNKMKQILSFSNLPTGPTSISQNIPPAKPALAVTGDDQGSKIKSQAMTALSQLSTFNAADLFTEAIYYVSVSSAKVERWGDVGCLLNESIEKSIIPPYYILMQKARAQKNSSIALEIFEHAKI